MKRATFEGHKKVRKEGADKRQAERNALTATQQLKRLDAAGLVAKKERARLAKLIEQGK